MAAKSWKFAESSHKTMVGLNKTDVKFQKELASLEKQQNTAVTNIANYQQAMKMSWRRLEERRAESPTLSKRMEKKKEKDKKGLLLQSNTKLYVDKTPSIYNPEAGSGVTMDDSVIGRASSISHLHPRDRKGPPPTALNEYRTSPYVSSPYSFRRAGIQTADVDTRNQAHSASNILLSEGSDPELSDTPLTVDLQGAPSQIPLIRRTDTNKKATLLKASTMIELGSSSTGPDAFKSFYGRPQTRGSGAMSPLSVAVSTEDTTEEEEKEKGPSKGRTEITLAEMFDQIRNCRYIRHYYPDGTHRDEYTD